MSGYDDFEPRRRRTRNLRPDGSGYAIAAMVLGIASCLIFCCWPVGILTSLGGLACGAAGLKTRARRAAIVGLVLSSVGLVFAVGFGVLMVVGFLKDAAAG